MADIDELRLLVASQIRESAATSAIADNLIAELARGREARAAGPVIDHEAAEAAAERAHMVARTEKFNKLAYSMRKSNKVKEYKDSSSEVIKEWLLKFDQEISTLKRYNGIADNLTREEIVELFKDKLSHQTINRLNTAFVAKEPVWTWEEVTYDQLKVIMREEYAKRTTEVSEVLLQFGPERLKKPAEMSVAKFVHTWQEQLPDCLTPTNDAEFRKLGDLIKRALFYHCLDDTYIQTKLCEMEEEETNFKKCFDQACMVEQRKKAFQEINTSGAKLDSISGISISKVDSEKQNNSNKGKSGNPDKSNGNRGRGRNVHDKSDSVNGNYENNYGNRGRGKYGAHENNYGNRSRGRGAYESNYGNRGRGSSTYGNNYGNRGHSRGAYENNYGNRSRGRGRGSNSYNNNYGQSKNAYDNYGSNYGAYGSNYGSNYGAHENYGNKSNNGECYECGKFGHYRNNCPSRASAKATEMNTDDKNVVSFNSVQLKATQVHAFYPTIPKMMTKLNVGEAGIEMFECDTAASHNILVRAVYDKLRNKQPKRIPELVQEKQQIQLADGTISKKVVGSVSIKVQAGNSGVTRLDFFVMNSPNNLLGRLALEKLWPEQYRALREATEVPFTRRNVKEVPAKSKVPVIVSNMDGGSRGVKETRPPKYPGTRTSELDEPALPDRRYIPPLPKGEFTKEMGEAYGKLICETYPEVFNNEKGEFLKAEATILIKEGHMDKLLKVGVRPPSKIPYGLENEYNEKLDELLQDCIPIDGKDVIVASQVVPVVEVKNGKKIIKRLAINYKSTINDHLQDIPHVYSTMNEQFDKLKGQYRTCIDLSRAFKQIKMTPGFSQRICAIVTPRGYYVPKRMQFGIKTAPAIWNTNMQKLIHGFNGAGPVKAACVVDDVCITGDTPKEHFENLHEFIYRLYAHGLKANMKKCRFYQNEVKFLGKIVDREGVKLDPATTEAIIKMPRPDDKSKLRSFLGHMSYISKHCPDMRKARSPLDELLKPDEKFIWNETHSKAFKQCKTIAGNSTRLMHFDARKDIVLTTDASPFGIGACLSHKVTDEKGKVRLQPIAYASASLKPSEKAYAQIDREGLAVYWAMNYFKQYLWCNEFELHTDCSALVKIFGPKNDLGGCATGRLNRWAALLMEFNFTVKHIKGTSNSTADNLSRLPLCEGSSTAVYPEGGLQRLQHQAAARCVVNTVQMLTLQPQIGIYEVTISQLMEEPSKEAWEILPLTINDVSKATRVDPIYGKLFNAVRCGSLDTTDKDVSRFNGIFSNLYIEEEVLYFGTRIVIPTKLQEGLLEELHFSHIGAVKMKNTVRKYFWWHGLTRDIDTLVKSCEACRKYRKRPPPQPLCPWPFSRRPMERVHVDFCEYKGKMILIMVDSYSKKIWTSIMGTDTTTLKTLAVLYGWFCEECGFPTTLVSDNGPQLVSKEFEDKMTRWGIKHLVSPPYHPASNGLAERAVGVIKDRLKKMDCSAANIPLYVGLKYITRVHGLTPHGATGRCPYELSKEGLIISLFPRLTDDPGRRREQNVVKHSSDKLTRRRVFTEGEKVVVYDIRSKLSTIGKICEVLGSNTYLVEYNGIIKHVSGDVMSKFNSNLNVNSNSRNVNNNSRRDDVGNSSRDDHTDVGRCPNDVGRDADDPSRADDGRDTDDPGRAHDDRWSYSSGHGSKHPDGGCSQTDDDGCSEDGVDDTMESDGCSSSSDSEDERDMMVHVPTSIPIPIPIQMPEARRRYRRRVNSLGPVINQRLRNR